MRSTAMQYLARSPSDIAVNTLEEVLRTSTDQNVLRSAARALASNPNPRARQAVRALIERADAPERLRIEAVGGFENSERTTDEDAKYLRDVYAKIDNPRVKARIARVIGQLGGEQNDAVAARARCATTTSRSRCARQRCRASHRARCRSRTPSSSTTPSPTARCASS